MAPARGLRRRRLPAWWWPCLQRLSCRRFPLSASFASALSAAREAAAAPALSAGRAVRRGHADRQPGRHHACARCTCCSWSTPSPARTRATPRRCCAPTASTSRRAAAGRAPAQRGRGGAGGDRAPARGRSASPMPATPARRPSATPARAWWPRCARPACRVVPLPGASSVTAAAQRRRRGGRTTAASCSPASCRPRPASASTAVAALARGAARRGAAGGAAPHRGAGAGAGRAGRAPGHRRARADQAVRGDRHRACAAAAGLAGGRCHSAPAASSSLVLHALRGRRRRPTRACACCELLLAELPVKTAVKLAAEITGGAAQRAVRGAWRYEGWPLAGFADARSRRNAVAVSSRQRP